MVLFLVEIKGHLGSLEVLFYIKLVVALSQDKEVGYFLYVTTFSTYIQVLCYEVIETSYAFLHSGFFLIFGNLVV